MLVPALSSPAKLSNWVSFNPHQRGISSTGQACLCHNVSPGSSNKSFSSATNSSVYNCLLSTQGGPILLRGCSFLRAH